MGIRNTIADNLKALRAATPKYKARPPLVKASGVPNGPLGRIENAKTNFGVDYLEGFAQAYGLQPWQLLVPGLKVRATPRGKPAVEVPGVPVSPPETTLSDQAFALAVELDEITDLRERTELWLKASAVIRNRNLPPPASNDGDGGQSLPPTGKPSGSQKPGKRRA